MVTCTQVFIIFFRRHAEIAISLKTAILEDILELGHLQG